MGYTQEPVYLQQLEKEYYLKSNETQFKKCNEKIREELDHNKDLRDQFTPKELEIWKNGEKPIEYTWHHNQRPGEFNLVDFGIHGKTGHTGGREVWGGGYD